MNETKYCKRCDTTKPIERFCKDRKTKDGHGFYCKDCVAIYRKLYQATAGGIYNSIKGRQRYYKKYYPTRAKPFTITKEWFVNWYNTQEHKCGYCGLSEEDSQKIDDSALNKADRLTIDCMDNEVGYTPDNIILSCGRCNFNKGDFFTHDQWTYIGKHFIAPKWESLLNKENLKMG